MLKIKIYTGNASFEDDLENELQRCLEDVIEKIQRGEKEFPIHDSNGSNVGSFKLTNR